MSTLLSAFVATCHFAQAVPAAPVLGPPAGVDPRNQHHTWVLCTKYSGAVIVYSAFQTVQGAWLIGDEHMVQNAQPR